MFKVTKLVASLERSLFKVFMLLLIDVMLLFIVDKLLLAVTIYAYKVVILPLAVVIVASSYPLEFNKLVILVLFVFNVLTKLEIPGKFISLIDNGILI